MASISKVWIVEYVGPDGKRCRKGDPGATPRRTRSSKFYALNVPGMGKRRIPLATDRQAARRMLDDLVRKAERGHAGLPAADPPLADLVAEFGEHLSRRGCARYRRDVLCHVRAVLAGCRCRTVADLRRPGLPADAERFAGGLPLAAGTRRFYLAHARQFGRWLAYKRHLLDRDPLAGVDLPPVRPEAPRRDLTAVELNALFAATAASGKRFRSLGGADRLSLYLTAAATGLRAGELGRLTADRFALDADPPTVRPVPNGPRSKTRDDHPLPLPPAVADHLRPRLAGLAPADRVWPGGWADDAAEMLRRDLAAAGVPVLTPAGEVVFHSLRHTFASLVVPVTDVKTAQTLLRHRDPALTIGRYAHTSEAAKADAVARMALPVPCLHPGLHLTGGRPCPAGSPSGAGDNSRPARRKRKNPGNPRGSDRL